MERNLACAYSLCSVDSHTSSVKTNAPNHMDMQERLSDFQR